MPKPIITNLENIPKLAKKLAIKLKGGEIFALLGPLGSGKTTFAKVLGQKLRVKRPITSPTFTLLHRFSARLTNQKPVWFYHLDLYRTKNSKEIQNLGLSEFWGKPNVITLIEWAGKLGKNLPKKTTIIEFKQS